MATMCKTPKGTIVAFRWDNGIALGIYGKGNFELKNTVQISTYNDHRIAMCFAILGTKIGNLKIENPDVVKKSFPNFWLELNKCYEQNYYE